MGHCHAGCHVAVSHKEQADGLASGTPLDKLVRSFPQRFREREETAFNCLDPSHLRFPLAKLCPTSNSLPHASKLLRWSFRGQTTGPTAWAAGLHPEEQTGG